MWRLPRRTGFSLLNKGRAERGVGSRRPPAFPADRKHPERLKLLLVVLERKHRSKTEIIVQNFSRFSPISCCFFFENLLDYISAPNVKEDRPGRGPRSEILWRCEQRRYSPTRSKLPVTFFLSPGYFGNP